jgi:hypothetical protein
MKYPLVMIEWYDAESEVTWEDPKAVAEWSKKDFIATEVGFLIHEDKNHIVLTSQIGSDGTIGNRTRIPKPWLKSRKKIKAYDGRKRGVDRTTNNTDSFGR